VSLPLPGEDVERQPTFGELIRAIRQRRGLSTRGASRASDHALSAASFVKLEHGSRDNPSLRTLQALADSLNIEIEIRPNKSMRVSDLHHVVGRGMVMAKIISCRAKVSSECLDGLSGKGIYEDGDPAEDGTWDWRTNSVVCTPCYIELMPLTPSGQGLTRELPDAIARHRREHAPA
jgi:transcriptional regulator with XRE-family HTH domain